MTKVQGELIYVTFPDRKACVLVVKQILDNNEHTYFLLQFDEFFLASVAKNQHVLKNSLMLPKELWSFLSQCTLYSRNSGKFGQP